jgi:hypothetical protein
MCRDAGTVSAFFSLSARTLFTHSLQEMIMFSRKRRDRSRSYVPSLEDLERRDTPTCTVTYNPVTETLLIKGDNTANHIRIVDNGLHPSSPIANVGVVCDGVSQQFNHVAVIRVQAMGGDDQVSYDQTGEFMGGRIVDVDLGPGNDRFVASLSSVLAFVNVELDVHGDSPSPVAGPGKDTIIVTAGGRMDGTLNLNIDGGGGDDRIFVSDFGSVGGQLLVNVDAGAGNDQVLANFQFAAPTTGLVSAHVLGGAGQDNMTLNIGGNLPPIVDGLLEGGPGIDTLLATPNVTVIP